MGVVRFQTGDVATTESMLDTGVGHLPTLRQVRELTSKPLLIVLLFHFSLFCSIVLFLPVLYVVLLLSLFHTL